MRKVNLMFLIVFVIILALIPLPLDVAADVQEAEITSNTKPVATRVLPNAIASGDTTQTSTVLWARSSLPGNLIFEVSTKRNFKSIVHIASREVTDTSVPAKVLVTNLTAGTDYFYRVTAPSRKTATGHFVTSLAPGTFAGLRFGVTGDWRGELSPYPALSNADGRDLDFFVFLGDSIYADYPSDAVLNPDGTRKSQAETLQEFRAKHNEVYSTRFGLNTLGDLRSSTSVLSTIDDHEVTDDFAGGAPPSSDPRFAGFPGSFINDTPLYENGLLAFQEYNPIQDEFYGDTGDARTSGEHRLYRFRTYGSDAAVFVLDGRSFRDPELVPANPTNPADVVRFILQSFDFDPATGQPTGTHRTMLGAQQLEDLKRDLLQAQAGGITWKFIMTPEPIQNLGVVAASDRFEGYAAERTEILRFINQNAIQNVVFVTADVHGTIVNNLTYQDFPFGPQIQTNAFEIVTGAVAFDAPFGPTVINLAHSLMLISDAAKEFYDSLPVAPDPDDLLNDKDDFLKQLLNTQINALGYDTVGLSGSTIAASLQHGDYVAVHTYGWTKFRINRQTQRLHVATFGIAPYSEAELLAAPRRITRRVPEVVSKFVVNPIDVH